MSWAHGRGVPLLVLVLCVCGLSLADITGQDPPVGTCLCLTGTGVNVRNPACGTVVGNHNSGCWRYKGSKETCSLYGTSYEFFQLDYSGGGWMAGDFLATAPQSSCGTFVPGGCADVVIVSRAEWNARSPVSVSSMSTPTDKIFIHHTVTGHCTDQAACSSIVRGIQNYHMDTKGWSDIGYNWLVGEDGRIYEGRGWSRTGAHTYGYNTCSAALSFLGNFMTVVPSAPAIQAARNMIQCGIEQGYVTSGHTLRGHRQVSTSQCPGDQLYAEIQSWPDYTTTTPTC